jgi:hypothetical protein
LTAQSAKQPNHKYKTSHALGRGVFPTYLTPVEVEVEQRLNLNQHRAKLKTFVETGSGLCFGQQQNASAARQSRPISGDDSRGTLFRHDGVQPIGL